MQVLFIPKNAVRLMCLFCLTAQLLWAQPFTKAQIYRMGQRSLQNMIRTDMDALRSLPAEELQKYRQAGRTPEEESIEFRGQVDLGISTTEKEAESEIHAAVNPKDSNNIIVASMKFGEGGILGPELTFPVYYTRDFGRTWKLSDFDGVNDTFSGFLAGGGDPIIVFEADGTAHMSWLTLTLGLTLKIEVSLNWAISRDGGATWKRQSSVIDKGELTDLLNPGGRFVDKQWMAVDRSNSQYRDNIYIAYAELNLTDSTYQILLKRKAAGSDVISAEATVLSPQDFVFAQFTSIDVDSKGYVHVLYAGARETDEVASLFYVRSTDGGATFSAPVRISPFSLPCFPPGTATKEDCVLTGIDPNRVYPCPHLRVDRSGGPHDGNLYAVWTADGRDRSETSGVDIYYSRSTDGGATWSVARVLNDDPDPTSHQFYPSMSVNDRGVLVVTWYDRREDPGNMKTKYYITYSEDGGATFAPDFPASSQSSDFAVIGQANGDFGVGEYTQVVTTVGYALPFWADGRGNNGNIEIFTTQIPLAAGVTTKVPVVQTVTDKMAVYGPFPNPVTTEARLTLQLSERSAVRLQLWQSTGQLLQSRDWDNLPEGESTLPLDVAQLPAGAYVVTVTTDFGITALPLVVKK